MNDTGEINIRTIFPYSTGTVYDAVTQAAYDIKGLVVIQFDKNWENGSFTFKSTRFQNIITAQLSSLSPTRTLMHLQSESSRRGAVDYWINHHFSNRIIKATNEVLAQRPIEYDPASDGNGMSVADTLEEFKIENRKSSIDTYAVILIILVIIAILAYFLFPPLSK